MTRYSRQDALRILRIHPKHLRGWERAGLLAFSDSYTFQDLVQLRRLRDLRAMRLSAASIRAGVDAMQAVSGMTNPLVEARAARSGSRLAFGHSGTWMEPVSRQFVFDFEGKRRQLIAVETEKMNPLQRANRISSLFLEAVRCEEAGKTEEAVRLYESILELDAGHAPAAINLGTIFYNQRQFLKSEELYRQATEADPSYALAFFDLGNALDELQRLDDAIAAYRMAIQLVPKYADAHYNLALAYERKNERRKALKHWLAYLKLDPVGPWANHARGQARLIVERDKLCIVWRRGKCASSGVPSSPSTRCCKA